MRILRKQLTRADKRTYEAHSAYTAGLGIPDRCRYRRTPPGTPTVADLVRPGDTVATSYSTGGVVIEVQEHFYVAPAGKTLSDFTSVYAPPDRTTRYRDSDRRCINECVAIGDRILMLFEANTDEVFVLSRARPSQPPAIQNHTHYVGASPIRTASKSTNISHG
ncbi:hypothetical protein NKH56_30610 [Mesorhizobium sp. M1076]|uniref:hypothetical protein n=1 Tax=Mesorhizobium sp. M1076 TaxID=2957054 RepID=UPI003338CE42